jgi:hypothetical protein
MSLTRTHAISVSTRLVRHWLDAIRIWETPSLVLARRCDLEYNHPQHSFLLFDNSKEFLWFDR